MKTCPICGKPVPAQRGKKPRKFCSKKCADVSAYIAAIDRGYKRPSERIKRRALSLRNRLAARDAAFAETDCPVTVEERDGKVIEWRGQRRIGCRAADHVRHS